MPSLESCWFSVVGVVFPGEAVTGSWNLLLLHRRGQRRRWEEGRAKWGGGVAGTFFVLTPDEYCRMFVRLLRNWNWMVVLSFPSFLKRNFERRPSVIVLGSKLQEVLTGFQLRRILRILQWDAYHGCSKPSSEFCGSPHNLDCSWSPVCFLVFWKCVWGAVLLMSGECMLLSLSRHKDLEWRTLKPPQRVTALGS